MEAASQPWRSSPTRREHNNTGNDFSTTSTPFVTAPSSPRESTSSLGYYLSTRAPTSPTRGGFDIRKSERTVVAYVNVPSGLSWEERGQLIGNKDEESNSFKSDDKHSELCSEEENLSFSLAGSDFDFSARFSEADGGPPTPMSTAEELFFNGKIRPLNRLYCSSELDSCSSNADYDGYYDFLSSADYGIACRGSQSPQQQRFAGLTKPTNSALERWKKSMGKQIRYTRNANANANASANANENPNYDEMRRKMQTCGGGGHRRARSLSPLRVFHMDDILTQPRPSFESETCINTTYDRVVGTPPTPRRTRKSRTLKELLNMGDSRVHESSLRFDRRAKCGEKWDKFGGGEQSSLSKLGTGEQLPLTVGESNKFEDKLFSKSTSNLGNVGDKLGKKGVEKLYSKSTSNVARSPLNQQALSAHENHYASQRAQAEVMKKKTFLPYKNGLLGCLGVTSKSYGSMKGLHTLNTKPR